MLGHEDAFTHLSHGVIGDASARREANTLVLSLRLTGALHAPRARLYRSVPHPAFRQMLAIDLDLDGDEESFLKGKRGLWLVEQSDHKVFLYAARRIDPAASIGGRVLPGRAVLHPTAAWLEDVAAVAVYRRMFLFFGCLGSVWRRCRDLSYRTSSTAFLRPAIRTGSAGRIS